MMKVSSTPAVHLVLIILILCTTIDLSGNWKTDRRPRLFGDRVPNRKLLTSSRRVQHRLVILHDYFRTKVVPSASNMLNMKWHRGAAKSAQRWANSCKFLTHDSPKGRFQNRYGSCGQNIFVSTHKVPWIFVMKSWFVERTNFTYGSRTNNLKDIGHYTQMVWAATHKFGCGIAKCRRDGRPYFNYVCNYCPIGNYQDRVGLPYRVGRPCSSCPNSCSINRKLCTNACHTIDVWSNCEQLYKEWPKWLCKETTADGLERRKKCGATCSCGGKIHD